MHVIHPFAPVFDAHSRILILGSLPSERSRLEGFYYGHPQNRFWPLMARLTDEPLPLDIPSKRELLLRHGIALWDVIGECDIDGSADASVRNAVPVDIRQIVDNTRLEAVLCNGALSAKLYRRYLQPVVGMEAFVLPSTSPANAAWSLERLVEAWGDDDGGLRRAGVSPLRPDKDSALDPNLPAAKGRR